jgi:hypothetical protein
MPPIIVRFDLKAANELYLQFRGRPGVAYTLQSSTNLVDWTNLRDLIAGPDGLFEASEIRDVNINSRFYQLSEP